MFGAQVQRLPPNGKCNFQAYAKKGILLVAPDDDTRLKEQAQGDANLTGFICKAVDEFEPDDEKKNKIPICQKIEILDQAAVVNGLPMLGCMEIQLFIISLVHQQNNSILLACEMKDGQLCATVS